MHLLKWISYLVESKKKKIIVRFSTEVEYHAMETTTNEIVWLRWLLKDMGVPITILFVFYCDNKSAIQIACNLVFHEQTNTLISIFILLGKNSSVRPLITRCFFFHVDCQLLHKVSDCLAVLCFCWQTLNVSYYRIMSLRGC